MTVPDLPDKPFIDWTLAEVEASAEGEPQDEMPGTNRKVPGPRQRLLNDMRALGAATVGELPSELRDQHRFSLKLTYADVTPEKLSKMGKDPDLSKAKREDAEHSDGVTGP